MTVSPATTLPNPAGTDFDPEPGSPFSAVGPKHEYTPLEDFEKPIRPEIRTLHAKALREVALEVLSEARLDDPNVRYIREVLVTLIDELRESENLTLHEYDDIIAAFDLGVEHSAKAVAASWLRERGSIPIPTE